MKSKGYVSWVAAGLCFAAYAAWGLLVARLIVNRGDMMMGFHPLILAVGPGVVIGIGSVCVLFAYRQWLTGMAICLGVLTLSLVIWNGHAIENAAWRRTIILHEYSNERSMVSISRDLQSDDLSPIWKEDELSPLVGFQWYGTNHLSAPNGVYFGFKLGGIPHVRIQKIRHGWRGVALVRSEADIATLAACPERTYSRVGSSNWFTWIIE